MTGRTAYPARVAVVGASAAGLACAEGLRRQGFDGRVTLVGEEREPPYDRPPLSKQLLSGAWPADRLLLRDAAALDALGLELMLGRRAVALDTRRREVVLDGGRRIGCDAVVVATGLRPRWLPGAQGVHGVHVLRTLADAVALRAALSGGGRLVVAGGGFIGAEVAAAARSSGCETTVVTPAEALLADAVGPRIGALLTAVHREHGVRVVTGARAGALIVRSGRVTGVRLGDGRRLPADTVLLGVGGTPNAEWLAGSSVPTGDGVVCDEALRAAPGVWACGDVAAWPDPYGGAPRRVEHRTNASEQGLAVARALLAGDGPVTPFRSVPYLWSDQYGLRLQVYGRPRGADRFRVVDGDPAEHRFTALFGRGGRVCAAAGMGLPGPLRALRALVAERAAWPAR
ncbi:FAD-dependent oxidoreductase [Streptomyces sp. V4-01]|uniref:FAD-dependent oxidoreductase n=1 Tax=Actinacidiphila polyblastidii TaxID=3110430 RepID=A0ABU7PG40_9ACTN|nr:FAD-dependent oxidoreductase [Streptomyces sp. V4-01]